jgi:hypothetical protein
MDGLQRFAKEKSHHPIQTFRVTGRPFFNDANMALHPQTAGFSQG